MYIYIYIYIYKYNITFLYKYDLRRPLLLQKQGDSALRRPKAKGQKPKAGSPKAGG